MTSKTASLLISAVFLVGCGTSGGSAGAGFDDDDVMFAQMMIPHHEQAIEMSDIALDPAVGAGEEVRALATRIKEAQDPEIDRMTALLGEWGSSTEPDPSMDHSSMMSGMLSADDLAALGGLRGTEFDTSWLQAMIAHHEGAVSMAREVLESGVNSDVRKLAESIVAGQQSEIEEMTNLVGTRP